ncbi:PWWP domain-containing DNA repair factor 3A-like isoform X1 [Embiotoca jacksoni]|uniref:PWWP domain-containing DNA repair factor 3A-like isoform X1 n=1 Tax=Embiotoca jacksoni TaxID=100190 RepID=UPI003703A632
MKGIPRKTRKREPKKISTGKFASDTVLSSATEESNAVPGSDSAILSQSSSLPSTPKRGKGRTRKTPEPCLTSTPVTRSSTLVTRSSTPVTRSSTPATRSSTPVTRSSTDTLSSNSTPPAGVKQVEPEYTEIITQLKMSELDSPCSKSKPQSRRKRGHASRPKLVRQRAPKKKTQTCSKASDPPANHQRAKKRKIDTENSKEDTTSQSSKPSRPRFELEQSDAAEQEESLRSSDLSIELSHYEEELPSFSLQEDEESDEDEEELPSFSMQVDKKPSSITEGVFVWCKFRNEPFWPALVKSVNRRQKKASIKFVDHSIVQKKNGFTVALKSLKPFDCEEADELMCKAKEKYEKVIAWSLELITDYRFRIACGSFSGSFIEYLAHDMSNPVRRMYPQAASERLTIASESMMEEPCDGQKEGSFSEQQKEFRRRSKRLLPDRTHAALNRANEKLVDFIVKQHMVEKHLLAVIRGQQQSRWLRYFTSANRRRIVKLYLEDDQQMDRVYCYLNELYATAVATTPRLAELKSVECVSFVLDVLLPEAIIHAIAGVDNISVKKAEEKYLKGRCLSNRERQELHMMVEKLTRNKSQHQNTSLALFSDPIGLED